MSNSKLKVFFPVSHRRRESMDITIRNQHCAKEVRRQSLQLNEQGVTLVLKHQPSKHLTSRTLWALSLDDGKFWTLAQHLSF
jgi:hypothetical protein